eukprot:jgi/Hompol1/2648/HPOL_006097-RA
MITFSCLQREPQIDQLAGTAKLSDLLGDTENDHGSLWKSKSAPRTDDVKAGETLDADRLIRMAFNACMSLSSIQQLAGFSDIESIALDTTQAQIRLWIPCIALLLVGGMFEIRQYRAPTALWFLYLNSTGVFAISTFLAYLICMDTLDNNSKVLAKRVLSVTLMAVNFVMFVTYALFLMQMLPKMPGLPRGYILEPARFAMWFVSIPSMLHFISDTTTGSEDISIFAKASMFQLLAMVISVFGLFQKAVEAPRSAMMDRRSMLLCKVFTIGGLSLLNLTWGKDDDIALKTCRYHYPTPSF